MHGKTWLLTALVLLGALVFSVVALGATQSIVFILDASNSMNNPFGTGSRLDAAKVALTELLNGMPVGKEIGLLVFGNQINHENEAKSCKDISVLFSLALFDNTVRSNMIEAIRAVTAQGMTPLADSLTEAREVVSANGQGGVIVLLSDGEGNCGGQQLVVAKMIGKMDPQVTVYVVGLDVEPEASDTLRAIAAETNGRYWSVSEASGLLSSLLAAIGEAAEASEMDRGIPAEYAAMGITNVVYGTDGNDRLYGTAGNDLIFGLGGDDFIIGLDGNDILIGGDGNDLIEGMNGCDIISGGAGDDVLFGGNDDDHLCGDAGNDSIEGEAGDDVLSGGPGCDKLLGGNGLNLLYTDGADDLLWQGKVMQGDYAPCVPPAPCTTCPQLAPPMPPAPCTTCPKPALPMPPAPIGCGPLLKSIDEGTSIQLHGTATDADRDVVSVLWNAPLGSFDDPSDLDPIYMAPMVQPCRGVDVCVTLVATDSCGATGADSFVLHINNVNHSPIINAGNDIVIDEGATIQLCATASDPDGDALKYHWSIPCGKGVLNDPILLSPVFTAPLTSVCEGEDIVLTLSVIDSCGASTEDSITIHVRNLNLPPIVELGPGFSMKEGTGSILHAVATDPECEPLTYYWTASSGTFDDAFSATPCFTAPLVGPCEGDNVTVSLTVTDVCGASTCDSFVIHVDNVNTPPVVKADP